MNIGLVIGKKNSEGMPGKNIRLILGRPSVEYAFIAARAAKLDELFVSTDCEEIMAIAKSYNCYSIRRPASLATPDALTEDALKHAYSEICKHVRPEDITSISLLFANTPTINPHLLAEAISILNTSQELDSVFSVCRYDMFSPARARKLVGREIKPFVPIESLGDVSSIRDSQGACYFCDLSIQVMKKVCFEDMDSGQLPFRWQGKRQGFVENEFGFDVDARWQIPVIEYWLSEHGFTEAEKPW